MCARSESCLRSIAALAVAIASSVGRDQQDLRLFDRQDGERRLQGSRFADLRGRLVEAIRLAQEIGVLHDGPGVSWIELDGAPIFCVGAHEIPPQIEEHQRQHRVTLRKVRVQDNGAARRILGSPRILGGVAANEGGRIFVAFRQRGPASGERGTSRDRQLVALDRALEGARHSAIRHARVWILSHQLVAFLPRGERLRVHELTRHR